MIGKLIPQTLGVTLNTSCGYLGISQESFKILLF